MPSERPIKLARTVGPWSGGTRVVYVGAVEGSGRIAVYAVPDKRRTIFVVDESDLVRRRPMDGLTRAQRGER